jgi:hypothetical protein
MAVASVPKVVSSSPAATATFGRESAGTISAANPNAAWPNVCEWETMTIPITVFPH